MDGGYYTVNPRKIFLLDKVIAYVHPTPTACIEAQARGTIEE
jgi:hypothetical protein